MNPPEIRNKEDVAKHFGVPLDSLEKALYKATECGVSIGFSGGWRRPTLSWFWVAGYCEGSDVEHPVHRVDFPCTGADIENAVAKADQDGIDTWNATHGCEKCYPEGTCDEWDNEILPDESGGPVNPECPECEGQGIII